MYVPEKNMSQGTSLGEQEMLSKSQRLIPNTDVLSDISNSLCTGQKVKRTQRSDFLVDESILVETSPTNHLNNAVLKCMKESVSFML